MGGRAAIVFASIYAAILIAVLGINAAASGFDTGRGNLRGPGLAIEYAASELREADGRMLLASGGRFAGLASRNPQLWLVVIRSGRAFTVGTVPPAATRSVWQLKSLIGTATFRVPDDDTPAGVVSVQGRELAFGPTVIAAGGVDPSTLSVGERIDGLLNPGVLILLGVIGAISLLAMMFAVPAFSRAVRPITTEADAIGPQEPGRRLDESKAPRELLPLVRGFNAALARLESELGRRRRLIADVAHELRTPLSVVALRVEALEDETGKAELRRGVSGLTHLVSQMLDLERLSLSSGERADLDLVTIARDVVADLAPMAIARGYDLSLSAPDNPVRVSADSHAIARALTNLVINAIVHGGGAGAICVTVGNDRTIDVADEGPGVSDALRPRLFEAFVRGESAVDGSGLGLHIVREIMLSHGGDVMLAQSKKGAVFRLIFGHANSLR